MRPGGALTREGARRIKHLPLDAGGDAELVLFGVRHSDPPGSPKALRAIVDAMSAEFVQPVDLGHDVVNHNVEVHAVLARFGLGYALKEKRRSDSFFGNEHSQVRIRVVVAIVERFAPERSESLWLCAVEHEFHSCLLSDRVPPGRIPLGQRPQGYGDSKAQTARGEASLCGAGHSDQSAFRILEMADNQSIR
jgi:hypothetical protein